MAKIDFRDSAWTSGIQIPDRLISSALQNGEEGYDAAVKILEALNIDWKNINIPWAQLITKWNATSVDPFNKTNSQFTNEFNEALAETTEDKTDNRVDWYNPRYDFLKERDYYDSTQEYPYIKPGWAANGRIEKSQDIVEILDYLIWRVITLDYFTNNWNNRNAFKVTCGIIFNWDNTTIQNISLPEYPVQDSDTYYPYIELDETTFANNIILIPDQNRNPLNVLTTLPQYTTFKEKYPDEINNTNIAFASNASGDIVITSGLPQNIGTITVGDLSGRYNTSFVNGKGDQFFKYIINLNLRGTESVYYGVNGDGINTVSWLDGIKSENYNFIDKDILETSIVFKQKSITVSADESSEEKDILIPIKVSKTSNRLKDNNSVSFNNSNIKTNRRYVDSDSGPHTLTIIEEGIESVTIPYLLDLTGYDNKYPINISFKYDENYGIHQYYFIKVGESVIGENFYYNDGTFKKFESEWGNIEYEDGEYYYVPCAEPKTHDNQTITIYCVGYYSDTENSRQCTPIIVHFDVNLTAEVKNKVLFIAKGETFRQWNAVLNKWENINANENSSVPGSNCVSTEPNHTHTVAETNITYTTRTLKYGENIDDDIETIIFDNFVTTYCGIKPKVEFLGVIDQSIDKRTINLLTTEQDGNYGKVTINYNDYNNIEYNIYKENYTNLGPDGGVFFYCNDVPENYEVPQDVFDSLSLEQEIDEDKFDIQTVNTDEMINESSETEYNKVFTLLGSTAKYPNENGIYKINENTAVNADVDYYYLVFKATCDRGTIGSISYSACKGYYFLRVVRNNTQPTLALRPITEDPIYYNCAGKTYSIRSQVRQTIYLNRLFSDESQVILSKYSGKKYWSFYNVDGQLNSAAKWDDQIVAINNILTGEEYMKIFNEGDEYPSTEYKFESYNYNSNTVIVPEGNVVACQNGDNITSWTSSETTEVKKFYLGDDNVENGEHSESSGAILYINKLMKAYYIGDDINRYEKVTSDSVILPLSLSIGNSTKFTRVNSTNTFMINIFKQRYDIDIMVAAAEPNEDHDYRTFNYYTLSNPFEVVVNNDRISNEFEITPQSSLSSFSDISKVWFASNEFIGTEDTFNSTPNASSVLANDDDSIPIIIANSTSKFSIKNAENFLIYPNISITSNNTNKDEWVVNSTFNKFDNYTDKNIVVVYPTSMNPKDTNIDYRRALYLFPMHVTQSIEKITFSISGDDYGIYADKELDLYVHPVAANSTVIVGE